MVVILVTSTGNFINRNARPGVLICQLIEAAGCDHVITMDLHDPQFQGYFTIPVDNLLSAPVLNVIVDYQVH